MTVYVDYHDLRDAFKSVLEEHTDTNPEELLKRLDETVGGTDVALHTSDTDGIIGQLIVDVRPMTDEEFEREGFTPDNMRNGNPPAIELQDGRVIFPSADTEGNRAGELFGQTADGQLFAVDHLDEYES